MDFEKLKKANDLDNVIKQVKERLYYWESANGISSINVSYTNTSGGNNGQNLDDKYTDFDVIKTLTVSNIKKHLQELESEFKNL